jgi:hypothetical protein
MIALIIAGLLLSHFAVAHVSRAAGRVDGIRYALGMQSRLDPVDHFEG